MKLRRLSLGLLTASTVAMSGCASKYVTLQTDPADATITVDGQYQGQGESHVLTRADFPSTMHVAIERKPFAPYQVAISSKPDYSLWPVSALMLALGAGAILLHANNPTSDAGNFGLELGIASLVLSPLPTFRNAKYENSYLFDLKSRTVRENQLSQEASDPAAVMRRLRDFPTLSRAYGYLSTEYAVRISDQRLAAGAIRGVLVAAGHEDDLPRFLDKPELPPFDRLLNVFATLNLNPYDRRWEYAAINGMLSEIGDPSNYFAPPVVEKFKSDAKPTDPKQERGVSGIYLSTQSDRIRVLGVRDNSPAWQAGILPDDCILAVNGESLEGLSYPDVGPLLHGRSGEPLDLMIQRGDAPPFKKRLVLEENLRPLFESHEVADGIGYIHSGNVDTTLKSFVDALEEYREKKVAFVDVGRKKLILDLRASGGVRNESLEFLAGMFIGKQTFGKVAGRWGRPMTGRVDALLPRDRAIVVLVDRTTAGSAEVLAAALHESGRALLVGEPTGGNLSEHMLHMLPDHSRLWVTSGLFITRNGQDLGLQGLQPDVVIPYPTYAGHVPAEDTQLARAIALLQEDGPLDTFVARHGRKPLQR